MATVARINELREKRARLIEAGRVVLDKAAAEKRELTTEEDSNYKASFAEIGTLKASIEREERQLELDKEAAEKDLRGGRVEDGNKNPAHDKAIQVSDSDRAELRSLYRKSYQYGDRALSEAERSRILGIRGMLMETAEHRAFNKFIAGGLRGLSPDEIRALSMGNDTQAGFLVPPEDYKTDLIKKIDDFVFIRQRATKMMVTQAIDLGVPTLENFPADADWTSELATGTADSTMSFGKRQFSPHPLAKQILISNKLLRASVIPVEDLVRDRFTYKFGISQEKAYMLGTGAGQPLGLFTASASGIPTSADVASITTSVLSPDDLFNAKFALKAPYRKEAEWLFNRTIVQVISKMKDGDGRYLWQPGLTMGTPDRILDAPVMESEYAPNTYSTGNYIGMYGVYRFYWIADALDMTIQRLDELYAASNQTGFIMRMETDGMPVLAEPFARLKLS